MARDRLRIAATAFFAALLFTAGLADDGSDSALKPVDLKKDAYDVTLQALPSGENAKCPSLYRTHPCAKGSGGSPSLAAVHSPAICLKVMP